MGIKEWMYNYIPFIYKWVDLDRGVAYLPPAGHFQNPRWPARWAPREYMKYKNGLIFFVYTRRRLMICSPSIMFMKIAVSLIVFCFQCTVVHSVPMFQFQRKYHKSTTNEETNALWRSTSSKTPNQSVYWWDWYSCTSIPQRAFKRLWWCMQHSG